MQNERLQFRRYVTALAFAACVIAPVRVSAQSLSERIDPLIAAHQGSVAVAIKNLKTGENYAHRADEPMPTASLIKLAVMVEAYRQADAKKLDLAAMTTLTDADKVPGSGILTKHFSAGTQISIRDAIRLMIAYSDNTATNLVLDRIGLPATAETMESLGFPNTKIHAKVYRADTRIFPERGRKFGLGSTTAAETISLLALLHEKKAASADACAAMLEHLAACEDKSMLAAKLPRGTKLAHKSGAVNDARTDAGILETPAGAVAICVLTDENKDQSWQDENAAQVLIAKIGRATYDHFKKD